MARPTSSYRVTRGTSHFIIVCSRCTRDFLVGHPDNVGTAMNQHDKTCTGRSHDDDAK